MLQVLINLLGNAIKFTPAGAPITVRASAGDGTVDIAVRDAGPGIGRDDLERIFDPFVTLDHGMTKDRSGAGLGLALVKRLTELHHGRVDVASELGAGSVFTLRLPALSERSSAPEHRRSEAPPTPGRSGKVADATRVLLVEDDEANVLMTQGYLESLGYEVHTVSDGASAVSAATRPDVSIILMDIQLPVMDGLEAIRRIRATPSCAQKAIIAITASAMPGDAERCFAAGATAYMSKPVRLRHLAETIAQHARGATT
jgi:CheY-like chemotaxis protein